MFLSENLPYFVCMRIVFMYDLCLFIFIIIRYYFIIDSHSLAKLIFYSYKLPIAVGLPKLDLKLLTFYYAYKSKLRLDYTYTAYVLYLYRSVQNIIVHNEIRFYELE